MKTILTLIFLITQYITISQPTSFELYKNIKTEGSIRNAALSQDETTLIVGCENLYKNGKFSNDVEYLVYDFPEMLLRKKIYFNCSKRCFANFAISENNVVFSIADTLKIYSVDNFNLIKSIPTDGFITTIDYSPDNEWLLVGTTKGFFYFDANSYALKNERTGYKDQVNSISYSSDNKYFAVGIGSSTLVYRRKDFDQIKVIENSTQYNDTRKVLFANQDNNLIIASDKICFYKTENDFPLDTCIEYDRINSMSITNNQQILAIGSSLNKIKLYNLSNYEYLNTIGTHNDFITTLSFDKTNKFLISASFDKTLNIFQTNNPVTPNNKGEKPSIVWEYPIENTTTINDTKITIKALINSKTPISNISLKIDGKNLSDRDFEIVENNDKNNFTKVFTKSINIEGYNKTVLVSLIASNSFGTNISNKNITANKNTVINPPPAPVKFKEKRLALVIGNSNYVNGNNLMNPKNDADSMESVLQKIGFVVIKKKNLTRQQTNSIMESFSKQLKNYDVGLFFYAGHGIELNGNNFIIPVDADNLDKSDVEYKCINTNWLQEKMAEAGAYNKTNIIILDACRNNPFRGWRSFSGDDDVWSPPSNIPSGVITAFAASQGQKAADGNGTNGLYTSILLKHIRTKGLDIERLFKRVRIELKQKGGQEPVEMNKLTQDFYFVPQQ